MAILNNPSQAEVVKSIKDLESQKVNSISDSPSTVNVTTESAVYNYIASGNNGKTRTLDNVDLNTITATGFYSCNVCTNRPTANNGVMLVLKNGFASDNLVQVYWTFVADKMWVRHKDLGTWKDWKRLINDEEIVNVINSSSTDNFIPTAKAVYDAITNAETPTATASVAGKVKPDGTSITVDADGTIHSQGGGGSVSFADITGNATDNTNLSNELNSKANIDANNITVVSYQTKFNNMPQVSAGRTQTGKQAVVVDSYLSSDGLTWYRKWSDGWKECGFIYNNVSAARDLTATINLPITFNSISTMTAVVNGFHRTDNNKSVGGSIIKIKSTSQVFCRVWGIGSSDTFNTFSAIIKGY